MSSASASTSVSYTHLDVYKRQHQKISPLYADTKKLWGIHYSIYQVQHEQERQNAVTRQKKREIEH